VIAENPGKSLDELVAEKKINVDQKAQALKKPALQAQIAQIEEQVAHYKEFAAQYEARLTSQKTALEKAHQEELQVVRANAVADTTEAAMRELRQKLLTLSKFLCAAANSRRAGETESLESRALEGVLFQVYAGNQDAVNSMIKLIDGADEKVPSVEGPDLEFSCEYLYLFESVRALILLQTEMSSRPPTSTPPLRLNPSNLPPRVPPSPTLP